MINLLIDLNLAATTPQTYSEKKIFSSYSPPMFPIFKASEEFLQFVFRLLRVVDL